MTRWCLESVSDGSTTGVPVDSSGCVLEFSTVVERWRSDDGFVDDFVALLASLDYRAFLWETPPVTRGTMARCFEFTAIDCPALDRHPDPSPFRDQLETAASESVTSFANLGGDARLVVPVPTRGDVSPDCSHLAAFTRTAPIELQRRFWAAVAMAMEQRVSDQPVWLSTSGLGVAWLHARLDDQPKYFEHKPYRKPPHGEDA